MAGWGAGCDPASMKVRKLGPFEWTLILVIVVAITVTFAMAIADPG
jgi:hypothetical protein